MHELRIDLWLAALFFSILTVSANLGTVCEILLDVIPTLEDVSIYQIFLIDDDFV